MDLIRLDAKRILRGYNRKELEERYRQAIASVLDRVVFEDVGEVLRSIGEAAKAIKPDSSVDNQAFVAGEIAKKIMTDANSSAQYRLIRRRKYSQARSPATAAYHALTQEVPTRRLADENLVQDLKNAMASMTARDAGVFLGLLAARYMRSCPGELYETWVRRENMSRFWTRFRIATMEGELMMTIDF